MVVDGGYVTFKMSFGNFDNWALQWKDYIHFFVLEGSSPRKELKGYKVNRNEGKEEQVSIVWEIRDKVMTSGMLPVVKLDDLEADDVVLCLKIFHPELSIMGIDKDFFQLPGVEYVLSHRGEKYSRMNVVNKAAAFSKGLADKHFGLYQILMGDAIDGIPRLLPKGKTGKQLVTDIVSLLDQQRYSLTRETMFEAFGKDLVLKNFQMVAMPYWHRGLFTDIDHAFDAYVSLNYFDPGYWTHLLEEIDSKVISPNQLFDLF